jgi:hypothetical protein
MIIERFQSAEDLRAEAINDLQARIEVCSFLEQTEEDKTYHDEE